MKKIIIVVLMTILTTFSFNQVNAVTTYEGIDMNKDELWSEFLTDSAYFVQYEVDLSSGEYANFQYMTMSYNYDEDIFIGEPELGFYYMISNASSLSLPINSPERQIGPDYEGELIFDIDRSLSTITYYTLYNLQVSGYAPDNSVKGVYREVESMTSTTENILQITYYYNIYNDTTPPPSGLYESIKSSLNLFLTNDFKTIRYYKGTTIYSTAYFQGDTVDNTINILPSREGYVFTGWKTLTGETFDYDNIILEEWYNEDDIFVLYASFLKIIVQDAEDPDIEEDIPEGFYNLLGVVNMNNQEGYMLVFVLLNVIIVILSMILKLKSYIPLIISIFAFTIFIYFGMFNVATIVILAMLYIILLLGNFIYERNRSDES